MTENAERNPIKKITYNKPGQYLKNLFTKISGENLKTIINFVDVLKLEPQNRRNSDIQLAIVYIQSLAYFNEFLTLREQKETFIKLINEFTWVLCYERYEKNTIIKRPKEFPEKFFLILYGTVAVLDLVVTKECLTEEQYMIYLIKMKILNEEEIIKKCNKYNKDIINIDTTDIEKYCNSGYKFKYNTLKLEALRDLYKHIFNIQDYTNKVPNLDEYIFVTKVINDVRKKNEDNNTNKKYFYILHYEKIGVMRTGRYFGDLCIKNINKERVCFFALEDTDIGYVDKFKYDRPKLFLPIEKKKERYIESYINSFYIFREVKTEEFCKNYAKHFLYKRYTNGEKLFLQNSFYDGVYLIIEGMVNIYTDRQINEISGLMVSLQYSLDGFSEFSSCLKNDKISDDNKEDFIKNPVYHTKEYSELSKGQKRIYLNKLGNFEVIGLNEYYSFSSQLMHFTVEIISQDALIIFIPKKIFYKIITSDREVLFSLKKIVELRSRYYIGKLKNYKDSLINDISNRLITNKNKRSKTSLENRKNNRYQNKNELFHKRYNSPISNENIIKDNQKNNLNQSISPNNNKNFESIFNKTKSNFNNTITDFNKTQTTNFNQTYTSHFNQNHLSNFNNSKKIDKSNYLNTHYTFTEPINENDKFKFGSYNDFKKDRTNIKTVTNFHKHKRNVLKKNIKISSKAFMSGFPFSVIKPEPEPETNKNILPIIKSYYF